ncbi:alpha/beta hydrolase [Sphingobacterium pedocola]|uniref:Alpha/beta hydrolase n=1 Tax=Sphingobacterium pedocola TaxID=2082722 RepID=A0ABR9TCJ2_9SPHI|nr:alpha/beta hydrolase [Sphingobacterium pedocola]MBE8723056.1 alpha/beta hydrolase [Sphingobacterium pedocola]
MIKTISILSYVLLFHFFCVGQERINLWPQGKMPNSKRIDVQDSIANERIYQVGRPRIQAFFTSQQENKGTAVLIIPGGGYSRLAYQVSGYQLAKWFNTLGMHAFVLEHRLPHSPDVQQRELAPLQDAQRAMRIIRRNALQWGIDPLRIGVMGSSAGGHLAATLSTCQKDISEAGDSTDSYDYAPAFQILISPVIDMGEYAHMGSRVQLLGENPNPALLNQFSLHRQVRKDTPRAFIVHAFNDNAVSAKNSLLYYDKLLESGVSSSLHIFPHGKHAIALRDNPGSTQSWVDLCEKWLMENDFVTSSR